MISHTCGTTLITAQKSSGHLIRMPTHPLPCNVSARLGYSGFITTPFHLALCGPFADSLSAGVAANAPCSLGVRLRFDLRFFGLSVLNHIPVFLSRVS